MTTETSNSRGEWIREWQGSGPQRGFHIREATRLHNNRVVAYLGDQVDGEQVDKLIAEHNGCHANGDPIHDAPSAREWCEQNSVATTIEWRAGWDACRVEFPRIAAAPPPAAARGDVRGLVAKWRGLANEALRRSGTWNGNDVADRIEFMADELEALAQQPAAVDEKYAELIYAVSRKYPGESRHETALRYIRQAESVDHGPAQAATQHQEPKS